MKRKTLEELNAGVARPGVTRRVFSGEGATLAFTTLEPGHTPRPHAHPHEQIVYVLSGRLRFTVGDEEATVGPGDMLVVPPGVEHWAQTLGTEPAVDLSVFSPAPRRLRARGSGRGSPAAMTGSPRRTRHGVRLPTGAGRSGARSRRGSPPRRPLRRTGRSRAAA